ncbi:hypothetical protein GCM10009834_50350 [Streptomonospora arabica]
MSEEMPPTALTEAAPSHRGGPPNPPPAPVPLRLPSRPRRRSRPGPKAARTLGVVPAPARGCCWTTAATRDALRDRDRLAAAPAPGSDGWAALLERWNRP